MCQLLQGCSEHYGAGIATSTAQQNPQWLYRDYPEEIFERDEDTTMVAETDDIRRRS